MNIERLGIRFNLDKEKDRKALEFLQGYDKERYKSLNKFLIEIIMLEIGDIDIVFRIIKTIKEDLITQRNTLIFIRVVHSLTR